MPYSFLVIMGTMAPITWFWAILCGIIILLSLFVMGWTHYNISYDGFVKGHAWMDSHEATFPRPTMFGNVGRLSRSPKQAWRIFESIFGDEDDGI